MVLTEREDPLQIRRKSKKGDRLTRREKEVLILIADGKRGKQIAELLGLSIKTVDTYRVNIKRKLDLNNPSLLTHYAISKNMIKVKTFPNPPVADFAIIHSSGAE